MNDAASEACQLACIRLIERIHAGVRVAVDSSDEVLTEYLSVLERARVPGAGAKLAKHLRHLKWDDAVCHLLEITPTRDGTGSYEEVPAGLRTFDSDDQKFIAVAIAEGSSPCLYQALDVEWWDRRADFLAAGIDLQFVCPVEVLA